MPINLLYSKIIDAVKAENHRHMANIIAMGQIDLYNQWKFSFNGANYMMQSGQYIHILYHYCMGVGNEVLIHRPTFRVNTLTGYLYHIYVFLFNIYNAVDNICYTPYFDWFYLSL